MPSYSKIGAQIGVEGYDKFHREITNIKNDLKGLQSEMKVITSSFTAESKSIQDVNKQRAKLSEQIAATSKKLETELDLIERIKKGRATEIPAEYAKKRKEILESGESEAEIKKQLIKAEADYNAAMQRSVDEQRRLETQSNNTQAALNNLNNEMNDLPADKFIGRVRLIKDAIAANDSELKQWGDFLSGIGSFMSKAITAPIVAGAAASVKAFSDVESAYTGVLKTVELETKTEQGLMDELWDVTLKTASSFEEVAAAAEIGGQLGVADSQLKEFTMTAIRLGDSTDLLAEDAAKVYARIANIMPDAAIDDFEKFGNVVVWLGNNFATSESEIFGMANRLAPAAALAKISTTDMLALATAMSSVGITAEAGGTSMAQTLTKIEQNVVGFKEGTENNLAQIAEISGMSAEAFADAWKNQPIVAIQNFIKGLGNLDEQGESATLILDELGMSGIRQSNMLKSLSLASEVLTDAISGANTELANGSALIDESDRRYGTFETQVQNLKDSFQLLGSTVGKDIKELLLPVVQGLADGLQKLSTWWKTLTPDMQNFILILGGVAAAIGPLLLIVGKVLVFISEIKIALAVLGTTFGALSVSLLSTVGIVVAIIAVIVAVVEVIKNWGAISDYLKEKWEGVKEWFDGFLTWISTGFESFITWLFLKIVTFGQDAKNAGVQIKADISQLLINIVNWVRDKLTEAGNFIRDKLNTIRTFFTDLASSAWNWGKDLIGNFIDGIKNKFGQLKDSVVGIANMIASHIHFSEPDVGALSDFHKWMPDMMHGLAKGIDDNLYLVDNAISRVADAMNLGNSVNYGGVVINLNVPSGTNGRQLVDEIETELANRTLRRKAVFE